MDRGGKGFYIGAFNEFVEFVAGYYGVTYSLSSIDACAIAKENLETKKEVGGKEAPSVYIGKMSLGIPPETPEIKYFVL